MATSGYAQLGALKRKQIGDKKTTNMYKNMFSDAASIGQFLIGQASESKTAWDEYDAGAKMINPGYQSQNPHLNLDKTDFKLTDWNTWGGQATDIKNRFSLKRFQKPSEGFEFGETKYDSSDIRAVGKLTEKYDPKLAKHGKTLYDQWYGDNKNINPTNP